MIGLKGNMIYLVLYNYSDKNFSILKTMDSLEKAYGYICSQESNLFYDEPREFKLLEVEHQRSICEYNDVPLAICYIQGGKYLSYDFDNDNVSQYIIVPMTIE